jgi:hypothetical protein
LCGGWSSLCRQVWAESLTVGDGGMLAHWASVDILSEFAGAGFEMGNKIG